jgi:hypothetical protein
MLLEELRGATLFLAAVLEALRSEFREDVEALLT